MLENLTKIPVAWVVPYFYLDIDDEDSLSERFKNKKQTDCGRCGDPAAADLEFFTDFAPLEACGWD